MQRQGWILLAVLVVAAVGGTAWVWSAPRTDVAPDFALTSTGFENGTVGDPVPFRLSDFRGRVVLLDFMAVNCATCRTTTDEVLRPLWEAHRETGDLVVVSIDVWAGLPGQIGETHEDLVALQQEEDVAWRHALDTDGVYQKYRTTSLPQLTIVGPEGRIAYSAKAPQRPSVAEAESIVAEAQAGTSESRNVAQYGLAGLALVAGVAAFFFAAADPPPPVACSTQDSHGIA